MSRLVAVVLTALALSVAACTAGGSAVPAASTAAASASAPPAAIASPDTSSSPEPEPDPSVPPTTAPSPSPSSAELPARWARLDAGGPAAREDHTLTATPDGQLWLFGGRDGGRVHGDLWRLDLATDACTEVAVEGEAPAARFGHTATWVDGVGLVVWSGQAGSTFFDDLWVLDPATATWREPTATGKKPAARYGSCAALGPDGRLWVSHGFTSDFGRFDDTWAYDFDAGAWSDISAAGGPFVRCLHDCLFTPDGRFVVYAGQTTGAPAIGDLWTRPVDGGWTESPTPEPAPRQLYSLAVRDGHAWVFGGEASDGAKLGDLWRLDLETLAWQLVELPADPSPRSGAALAWDESRDRLILVGGLTGDGASAETWALEFGG
jgi:hypothetical protein